METPANGNGSCRQRETILNHTIIIIDRVNTFSSKCREFLICPDTLHQLCQRNRDGSNATQADRQRSLPLWTTPFTPTKI
jgi:hypothetical protein